MKSQQQTIKSIVAVKLIPCATTKGMMHHVRGVSEDNPLDKTMLHFRANALKIYEAAEVISEI